MKELVVYFSHNGENYGVGYIEKGNTALVAEKIASLRNADIYELDPDTPYPISYKECADVAKKELEEDLRPKFSNPLSSIYQYDVIYLGFPNWWGTIPNICKTFLESYSFKDKKIILFTTHEGSGFGDSLEVVKKLCNESTIIEGLALQGQDVRLSAKVIEDWVNTLE